MYGSAEERLSIGLELSTKSRTTEMLTIPAKQTCREQAIAVEAFAALTRHCGRGMFAWESGPEGEGVKDPPCLCSLRGSSRPADHHNQTSLVPSPCHLSQGVHRRNETVMKRTKHSPPCSCIWKRLSTWLRQARHTVDGQPEHSTSCGKANGRQGVAARTSSYTILLYATFKSSAVNMAALKIGAPTTSLMFLFERLVPRVYRQPWPDFA